MGLETFVNLQRATVDLKAKLFNLRQNTTLLLLKYKSRVNFKKCQCFNICSLCKVWYIFLPCFLNLTFFANQYIGANFSPFSQNVSPNIHYSPFVWLGHGAVDGNIKSNSQPDANVNSDIDLNLNNSISHSANGSSI